uniref:Inosine/uridine-preferring nucleoside hydrolase domain-containing protein n=1 Tax=Ciona savignyi TaxID=51511 RepID=H2Z811_CIOSA
MNEEFEKYILHDCDTGADDAIAVMMLLSHSHRVKAVALTCVGGNTKLNDVVMNNLRLLKLYNMLDKVPVYKGCGGPILPVIPVAQVCHIHGSDGMGDVPSMEPAASDDLLQNLQEEHAVNAIIRISKEYNGKLSIIATGPLTNLAMAVRLDPELPSRLKEIFIMGGTRLGKGNTTPAAEFNFHFDPEGAHMTLSSYAKKCAVHLIDYEVTLDYAVSWPWFHHWLSDNKNKKTKFAKAILETLRAYCEVKETKEWERGMSLCDAYAMAILLNSAVGLEPKQLGVAVELSGFFSRGSLVVDHFNRKNNFSPVTFYEGIDLDLYKKLLIDTFL